MGDRQTFQVMPSAPRRAPATGRSARALPFRHENEVAPAALLRRRVRQRPQGRDRADRPRGDVAVHLPRRRREPHLRQRQQRRRADHRRRRPASSPGYSDVRAACRRRDPDVRLRHLRRAGHGERHARRRRRRQRHRLREVRRRRGQDGHPAAGHVADQRRPGEEEPRHGDRARPTPSTRCASARRTRGTTGARRDRGRGRDRGPADHALLEPVPALPLPELRVSRTPAPRGAEYQYASPVQPAAASTPTQTGAKIVDGKIYVNNGFWDTYRTTWPAYSLLTPNKAGEMVDGFVQQYRDGGWISRWSSPGYAEPDDRHQLGRRLRRRLHQGRRRLRRPGHLRGRGQERDGHPAGQPNNAASAARAWSSRSSSATRRPRVARASRGRSRATSTTTASRRWRRSWPTRPRPPAARATGTERGPSTSSTVRRTT